MDPADLLFLHSTLAATIRGQQQTIAALQAELARLTADQEEPSWPTPTAT